VSAAGARPSVAEAGPTARIAKQMFLSLRPAGSRAPRCKAIILELALPDSEDDNRRVPRRCWPCTVARPAAGDHLERPADTATRAKGVTDPARDRAGADGKPPGVQASLSDTNRTAQPPVGDGPAGARPLGGLTLPRQEHDEPQPSVAPREPASTTSRPRATILMDVFYARLFAPAAEASSRSSRGSPTSSARRAMLPGGAGSPSAGRFATSTRSQPALTGSWEARHVRYGAQPEHYPVVGQVLDLLDGAGRPATHGTHEYQQAWSEALRDRGRRPMLFQGAQSVEACGVVAEDATATRRVGDKQPDRTARSASRKRPAIHH
jgi:hemoglobin-like flavoprotein